MPEVKLTSGATFAAENGASLLSSATAANVRLPYSCGTGRCSSCKVNLISGKTVALSAESGLSSSEKQHGWILSCVRAAETDLVIDVEDLAPLNIPPTQTFPCRISSLKLLSSDIVEVKLRLPPKAKFRFLPGQYIEVIGPNGIRRSYSIACADSVDQILELHVRSVDNGVMSAYWFQQAIVGDLLRIRGPLGTFFLRDTSGMDLVFLATGTGIAPVKSIIESLQQGLHILPPASVTVYWGGRNREDLYLTAETFSSGVSFVPVLSRPDATWTGETGYVQNSFLRTKPNISNTTVYACGSTAMIDDASLKLKQLGLSSRRFLSDAFVTSGTN